MYEYCEYDHELEYGTMIPVASYGDTDYYKCRYCRYVAPFSANITQNYIKTPYSDELHKCENDVEYFEYTFYEEHSFTNLVSVDYASHKRVCECGAYILEAHEYRYVPCSNNDYHLCICDCGYEFNGAHAVNPTTAKRAPCLLCGAIITIGNTTILPWGGNEEETE